MALKAVDNARKEGIKAGAVKLLTLWPLDEEYLASVIKGKKLVVVPEMNRGQLVYDIQRISEGKVPVKHVGRTDGAMIDPNAILEAIK